MKISRAEVRHEAGIFQRLSAGTSHHGRKHVLQLLDNFQIHGPNGTHEALVTDILVPMQYLRDLRIFDSKRTSYESILAIAYLNQCGIIHGGTFISLPSFVDPLIACPQDLHTDNIAFVLPGLAGLSAQTWMEALDDPEATPVIPRRFDDQSDSLPKYLVESADMTSVVKSVIKEHGSDGIYAVVIDFGSGESPFCKCRKYTEYTIFTAFHVSDTIPKPRTPPYICAPEILIGNMYLRRGFYNSEWVLKGDIWSLGCSVRQARGLSAVNSKIGYRSTKWSLVVVFSMRQKGPY
jgi:serine/threonine-protein kinase SRPK3